MELTLSVKYGSDMDYNLLNHYCTIKQPISFTLAIPRFENLVKTVNLNIEIMGYDLIFETESDKMFFILKWG